MDSLASDRPAALFRTLIDNRPPLCEERGYCGPFINEALFASEVGGRSFGLATCVHCGGTVDVETELERWERALWAREFSVEMSVRQRSQGPAQ